MGTPAATKRALEKDYEDRRRHLMALLTAAGGGLEAAGAQPVPACPAWSVHDVVAHLTGLCADVLAGNIAGAASDDWTAAQVDARRGTSLARVLDEWDRVGPGLAALLDDLPGWYGEQVLADLAVHEHDLRGALGLPGDRDGDAVAAALAFLVTTRVRPAAEALGTPPLELRAGQRAWTVGTGRAGPGDVDAAISAAMLSSEAGEPPPARPVGVLSGPPFELFRALTGRRSQAQVRNLDWSVEPGPYLPLFGLPPFTMRDGDLTE